MNSPFRKLVRIAIVLLVVVLLFNFFGYYLIHLKSRENEQLVKVVSIAGHQRTLSQQISKDVLLLINNSVPHSERKSIYEELQFALDTFKLHDQFLRDKVSLPSSGPIPPNALEIKRLFTKTNDYFKGIVAI